MMLNLQLTVLFFLCFSIYVDKDSFGINMQVSYFIMCVLETLAQRCYCGCSIHSSFCFFLLQFLIEITLACPLWKQAQLT